jgi:two-component system response regulator PilR (NtrC family)
MEKLVQEGKFRHDLYFRVHVLDVLVPPLRDRGADIILLAEHLCKKICTEWELPQKKLSPEVNSWLVSYPFPGNVRELHNIIQRALTLSEAETIVLKDLDVDTSSQSGIQFSVNWCTGVSKEGDQSIHVSVNPPLDGALVENLQHALSDNIKDVLPLVMSNAVMLPEDGLENHLMIYEKTLIEEALRQSKGHQIDAAKLLGMKVRSFRYRLECLGVDSAVYKTG